MTTPVASFTVTGENVDDLYVQAHGTAAPLANGHPYEFTDFAITPAVNAIDGTALYWQADVTIDIEVPTSD